MQALTSQEYAYLKSPGQRVRLYFALFGEFRLETSTTKRDATNVRIIKRTDWEPIINIGPHRLAFSGETLTFDARDSYKITFDGVNGRGSGGAADQGYGKGAALPNLDWRIYLDGTVVHAVTNQHWQTPISYTFTTPGLYTVRCKPNGRAWGGKDAFRWVRVHPDRDHTYLNFHLTEIKSLSGNWKGGWSAECTIQTPEHVGIGTNLFGPWRCVGIFAEDEWWDDATGQWVRHPIGSVRQDQRVVIIGYVREASVISDSVSRTISFGIDTVDVLLDHSILHKCAVWKGTGPKGKRKEFKKNNGDDPDDPNTVVDYNDNDVDNWGAILKGFRHVCTTDFVTYLLQMKTTALRWHDFYAVWNGKLAACESISGEESSILSNMQTAAENDWLVAGADHSSAIIFGPDRQVTKDAGWTTQWRPRMTFDPELTFSAKFTERLYRGYKYVKLIAIRPRNGKQLVGEFPAGGDENKYQGPGQRLDGTWFLKEGLVHDDVNIVRDRAKDVFNYLNLIWTASITCGLNRAVRCGDYIRLNLQEYDPDEYPKVGSDREFLVLSYSASIDVKAGSWITTLELEDSLRE